MIKILITTVFIIVILISNAYADILKVRFECNPEILQGLFLAKGYIVDLEGERKSPYSWGLIKNQGMEYEIITYKPVTEKELDMIKEIIWQSMGK